MSEKRTLLLDRNQSLREKKAPSIDADALEIINCFRDNINRIKSQFDVVDHLMLTNQYEEALDILRFQIVYGMSALDYFLHEMYVFCFIKIFRQELPKTSRYDEYKIPLKLLEKAITEPENIEEYLEVAFNDINSTLTFMSSSKIKELLNIITIEDEFKIAENKLKKRKIIKKSVRLEDVLNEIYDRRNKIAHQTDINHGHERRNEITKDLVVYYINVIENFVEEIYKVIISQIILG